MGHPVLGKRICVLGPSSCGKSTFADKIGKKYGLAVYHLDKLHHQPYGSFIPRPREEFLALHDTAIAEDEWIMEGNYTRSMPQRFDRASAIIVIERNRFGAVYRYVRRYWLQKTGREPRLGQPDFVEEKFSWKMIWWIMQPRLFIADRRRKEKERDALFAVHAKKIRLVRSFKELDALL